MSKKKQLPETYDVEAAVRAVDNPQTVADIVAAKFTPAQAECLKAHGRNPDNCDAADALDILRNHKLI